MSIVIQSVWVAQLWLSLSELAAYLALGLVFTRHSPSHHYSHFNDVDSLTVHSAKLSGSGCVVRRDKSHVTLS